MVIQTRKPPDLETEADVIEDARARQRRHRLIGIALLAAAAAAVAGALVIGMGGGRGGATAGLNPRNPPPETSVPGTASPAAVASASRICAHSENGTESAAYARAFTRRPVLTDAQGQGKYTAVIAISDGHPYSCLTTGNPHDPARRFDVSVAEYGRVRVPPGPDQISDPYVEQIGGSGGGGGHFRHLGPMLSPTELATEQGGGYGDYVLGQAGSDASAVTFTFANGDTVVSTIRSGWYFAWWPWISAPTSVSVTTSAGTTSSLVSAGQTPEHPIVPACQPDKRRLRLREHCEPAHEPR